VKSSLHVYLRKFDVGWMHLPAGGSGFLGG